MATFWSGQLLVLALLISNAAAGLASGLAGSLALAAAAVLGAVAQVLGLDGLDMLHGFTSLFKFIKSSLPQPASHVNHIFHTFHTSIFQRSSCKKAHFRI